MSSKSNALLFVLLLSFLDDVGNLGSGKAKRVKDSNPLVAPRWWEVGLRIEREFWR